MLLAVLGISARVEARPIVLPIVPMKSNEAFIAPVFDYPTFDEVAAVEPYVYTLDPEMFVEVAVAPVAKPRAAAPAPKLPVIEELIYTSSFVPAITYSATPVIESIEEISVAQIATIDAPVVDSGSPFGVIARHTPAPARKVGKNSISFGEREVAQNSPFVKSFSAIRPEVRRDAPAASTPAPAPAPAATPAPRPQVKGAQRSRRGEREVASANLKNELARSYLAQNQFLAPLEDWDDEDEDWDWDDEWDDEEDHWEPAPAPMAPIAPRPAPVAAAPAAEPLNLKATVRRVELPSGRPLRAGNREVLQLKLSFDENSAAMATESVNLLRSFAQVATNIPTTTIEIGVPEVSMGTENGRVLAARRVAIVSNVMRGAGVADRQINPVLVQRDANSFTFRAVDNDVSETIRVAHAGDELFGDGANVQTFRVNRW